jgi:hypothetical protein
MAKIKVSQSTIDQIKKMGMDKALKSAPGASAEMKEGLRRMYGERRLAAAGGSTKAAAKSTAPSAISGKMKSSSTSNKPKSSAPSAISGKKVSTTSKKAPAKKENTTSNPFTALHNKLSPVGNKTQKFKSPLGEGLGTKKPVKGKPSVGEQISGVFTGKTKIGPKPTSQSVAATMAKRMGISVAEYNRRLNAKKK